MNVWQFLDRNPHAVFIALAISIILLCATAESCEHRSAKASGCGISVSIDSKPSDGGSDE